MRSWSKILIFVSLSLSISGTVQAIENRMMATGPAAGRIAVTKPTHTLIATRGIHTFNNLSCDLAVLMALDHQSIRIIRIDPPSGKINASYISNHPELRGANDIDLSLASEFNLRGRNIVSVSAQIAFEDGQKDVAITVVLDDGTEEVKNHPIYSEFLSDSVDQCSSLPKIFP